MAREHMEIAHCIQYPIDKIIKKFGTWFLTSTVAEMLALALTEFPDEIGLWGVEMAQRGEYLAQKQGCRFFIQAAQLIGIKVTAPPGCEVMKPGRIYAYPDPRDRMREDALVRRKEIEERIATLNSTHTENLAKTLMLRGALEITLPPETIKEQLAAIVQNDNELERVALVLNGALQDQDHVLDNWL